MLQSILQSSVWEQMSQTKNNQGGTFLCIVIQSAFNPAMGENEIPYPSGRSSGRTVAFCRPRRGRGHSETVAHGERGQEWTPSDWWIRERCGYLSPHSTLNITATSREFKQALMTGETLTWWRGPPACRRGRHTRHSMCSQRACKRQWFKYAAETEKKKDVWLLSLHIRCYNGSSWTGCRLCLR